MSNPTLGARPAEKAGRYPVSLTISRPQSFRRRYILARLLIGLLFFTAAAFIWFLVLVYIAVPVLAASFISRDGGERYLREDSRRIKRLIAWLIAFDAFISLLTDRISLDDPEEDIEYKIEAGGRPTVISALLRIFWTLPSVLALAVIGIVSLVSWLASAACVLASGTYPQPLYRLHLGIVVWGARLLAYHASLTGRYPPFSLDTSA